MDALILIALLAGPSVAASDTTVEMSRGDQVSFESLAGDLVIESWDRDVLEIRGMDDDETGVRVRRAGSRVSVVRDDGKGRRRDVEIMVRVPEWAAVTVSGRNLDVIARRLGGPLTINNGRGDVLVEDAAGAVTVGTIDGEIRVLGADGPVTASSQSDDVVLHRIRGDVAAHSGDGDVELVEIDARSVEAETQDGDIDFIGTIRSGGSYGFYVHDGDATIAIPESAGARILASTYDGDFESDFPVVLDRFTGGREFEFTVGDGGAAMRIQVFDGEIRLIKR